MDLKELASGVNPKTHWYYQSKKKPMFDYFNSVFRRVGQPLTVIDFGAGSGFFALELLEAYPDRIKAVLLVDIGYTQAEMLATKGQKVQKMHYIPQGVSNALVLMMDVLEHLEDDYGIFKGIFEKMGNHAYYFITVPAFMSLWSGHDVYLEHYRRYTLPSLRRLVTSVNSTQEGTYYIYGALFPVAWVVRRIKNLLDRKSLQAPEASDMKPLPAPLNELLKQANLFEMRFRRLNRWFGITAVSEGRLK